eukprot:jgi/Bigna1/75603/fgenesh1_pg.35_\
MSLIVNAKFDVVVEAAIVFRFKFGDMSSKFVTNASLPRAVCKEIVTKDNGYLALAKQMKRMNEDTSLATMLLSVTLFDLASRIEEEEQGTEDHTQKRKKKKDKQEKNTSADTPYYHYYTESKNLWEFQCESLLYLGRFHLRNSRPGQCEANLKEAVRRAVRIIPLLEQHALNCTSSSPSGTMGIACELKGKSVAKQKNGVLEERYRDYIHLLQRQLNAGAAAQHELAMFLLHRGDVASADRYLRTMGFRWRLNSRAFSERTLATSSLSRGCSKLTQSGLEEEGETNKDASSSSFSVTSVAPAAMWPDTLFSVFDSALPNTAVRMLRDYIFNPSAHYWEYHLYNSPLSTGYFSYWYPFNQQQHQQQQQQQQEEHQRLAPSSSLSPSPSLSLVELIIRDYIWPLARKACPVAGRAVGAEWWAHSRGPLSGHQMHFDTDESKIKEGSEGWMISPEENRLLVFDGSLLHGVVPSAPLPNQKKQQQQQPPQRRLTLMVGFWGNSNNNENKIPEEEEKEEEHLEAREEFLRRETKTGKREVRSNNFDYSSDVLPMDDDAAAAGAPSSTPPHHGQEVATEVTSIIRTLLLSKVDTVSMKEAHLEDLERLCEIMEEEEMACRFAAIQGDIIIHDDDDNDTETSGNNTTTTSFKLMQFLLQGLLQPPGYALPSSSSSKTKSQYDDIASMDDDIDGKKYQHQQQQKKKEQEEEEEDSKSKIGTTKEEEEEEDEPCKVAIKALKSLLPSYNFAKARKIIRSSGVLDVLSMLSKLVFEDQKHAEAEVTMAAGALAAFMSTYSTVVLRRSDAAVNDTARLKNTTSLKEKETSNLVLLGVGEEEGVTSEEILVLEEANKAVLESGGLEAYVLDTYSLLFDEEGLPSYSDARERIQILRDLYYMAPKQVEYVIEEEGFLPDFSSYIPIMKRARKQDDSRSSSSSCSGSSSSKRRLDKSSINRMEEDTRVGDRFIIAQRAQKAKIVD